MGVGEKLDGSLVSSGLLASLGWNFMVESAAPPPWPGAEPSCCLDTEIQLVWEEPKQRAATDSPAPGSLLPSVNSDGDLEHTMSRN